MSGHADRNLLYGILALQMDFVSRDQLIDAMNAWVLQKQTPLEEVLRAKGHLEAEDAAVLGPLVARHLRKHGNDARRSLASLQVERLIREALSRVADGDVQSSVGAFDTRGGAPTRPLPAPGGEPGARYRRLREHARGGLGEVSVALDTELNREVALKEIQEQYADFPDSRLRFIREAEITGNLEHPGIVPVYGLGVYADGRPYYAMRFIRGQSLQEAIKGYHASEKNELALRKLLNQFVSACNAVAFAHSRGVIHRDLKPANVMLGDYGETLVVDWGLARLLAQEEDATMPPGWVRRSSGGDSTPTEQGQAVGTPAYMPPEQARGHLESVGPGSDVFALGATLYHILTGQAPYKGSEALLRAAMGEWQPARQVNRDVPPALEAVCARAMAPEPAQRYASARDPGEEVERWLADEPVGAYGEPLLDRTRRWGRKHRTLVSSAVVFLLVGVVGLGVGLSAVQAEQRKTAKERDLAVENEQRALSAEAEAGRNLKAASASLALAK